MQNPKYYDDSPAPYCNDEKCGEFDGKRCRKLGHRPGTLCLPTITDDYQKRSSESALEVEHKKTLAIRNGALEEAAQLCERVRCRQWTPAECASQIRCHLIDGDPYPTQKHFKPRG